MAMVPHVSQNFTVCFLLLSIITIQSRNHFTEQETQFASGRNRLTIHSITSVMKMRQDAKTRWLVMSLIRGLPFGEGAVLLLHPTKKENLPIRSCNRNFFNRKGVHCILSVVLLLEAQGQLY